MTESEKNFFSLVHPDVNMEGINNEPGYIFYQDVENMLSKNFGYVLSDTRRNQGTHVKFIRPFRAADGKTFVFVFKHPYEISPNKAVFQVYKIDYDSFMQQVEDVSSMVNLFTFIDQKIELVYETVFSFLNGDAPTNPQELAQLLMEKAYSPAAKAIQNKYGTKF